MALIAELIKQLGGGKRSPTETLNKRAAWESLFSTKRRDESVCHALLGDPKFFTLLLRIDHDLAEQVRAGRCRCGGVLHRADYPRKPRGGPPQVRAECASRLSFCCAVCRGRTTSMSVRFLGQHMFDLRPVVAMHDLQRGLCFRILHGGFLVDGFRSTSSILSNSPGNRRLKFQLRLGHHQPMKPRDLALAIRVLVACRQPVLLHAARCSTRGN